jgi:hypothetical protein
VRVFQQQQGWRALTCGNLSSQPFLQAAGIVVMDQTEEMNVTALQFLFI